MMTSALMNAKFTGEYWDYTTTIDEISGAVDNYFLVKTITFSAVVGEKAIMYLYYPTQLKYNAQIRNLRDSKGNLVFGDVTTGSVGYIGVSEPSFNLWGEVIGYRHDLKEQFTG